MDGVPGGCLFGPLFFVLSVVVSGVSPFVLLDISRRVPLINKFNKMPTEGNTIGGQVTEVFVVITPKVLSACSGITGHWMRGEEVRLVSNLF
jgi:hypothetical protein